MKFGFIISRVLLSVCLTSLVSIQANASGEADGICSIDSSGGLAKASCLFPSCPQGGTCGTFSAIDKNSAKIEYYEPLLQWKDRCPNTAFEGSCWEVYIDFKLRFAANSQNGVSAIGVNIAQDIDTQRTLKKYWAKAETKSADGRYEMNGGMVIHVPASKRLNLSVFELCVRENNGSESCVSAQGFATNKMSLGTK